MAADPTPQRQLPITVQLHILSFLGPNEHALSGRLVSPDLAQALDSPQHCTAYLSHPLPPYAAPWAMAAGQQHVRQLPFWGKFGLLCAAATSSSEVNLEVALALLQPSIFYRTQAEHAADKCQLYSSYELCDAAVKTRDLRVIDWLLHGCRDMVSPTGLLKAAAQHCSLAGLQAVGEAMWSRHASSGSSSSGNASSSTEGVPTSDQYRDLLNTAARSASADDAIAKMEWLLAVGGDRCRLNAYVESTVAGSGDLARLQWVHERDANSRTNSIDHRLVWALPRCDLAVVQWLVDEGGYVLPEADENAYWRWNDTLRTAAGSSHALAKLQWLLHRGAPLHAARDNNLKNIVAAAAGSRQPEVLQYLLSYFGPGEVQQVGADRLGLVAAESGSIPMLQWLRQAGVELSHTAYEGAGRMGSLPVVQWLAQDAGVTASGEAVGKLVRWWPGRTVADRRRLLEAVQLLVGEEGCREWDVRSALCAAARRGDLPLVQYLLQQAPGYVKGAELLVAASEGGCEALLEWLVGQQPACLEGPWEASPYVEAAKAYDRCTLTALRRLGVPWGAEDDLARLVWYLTQWRSAVPVLRWLVEQGVPMGSKEMGAVRALVGDM